MPRRESGRKLMSRAMSNEDDDVYNDDDFLHEANCDVCQARIRGVRYKCSMCGDYDNCEGCWRSGSSSRQRQDHPSDHLFIAIKGSQISVTQKYPCTRGRVHKHENKQCNGCCVRNMEGYCYQCVQCQLDFCEACEAKAVHDPSHVRLKIPAKGMFPDLGVSSVRRVPSQTPTSNERIRMPRRESGRPAASRMLMPTEESGRPTSRFPSHWGASPGRQTRDYVRLPGEYGRGSGTLRKWIQKNMDADQEASGSSDDQLLLFNDEGNAVHPGNDDCTHLLYCGKRSSALGSDGTCGPNNGPQCESCERYQIQDSKK